MLIAPNQVDVEDLLIGQQEMRTPGSAISAQYPDLLSRQDCGLGKIERISASKVTVPLRTPRRDNQRQDRAERQRGTFSGR